MSLLQVDATRYSKVRRMPCEAMQNSCTSIWVSDRVSLVRRVLPVEIEVHLLTDAQTPLLTFFEISIGPDFV